MHYIQAHPSLKRGSRVLRTRTPLRSRREGRWYPPRGIVTPRVFSDDDPPRHVQAMLGRDGWRRGAQRRGEDVCRFKRTGGGLI